MILNHKPLDHSRQMGVTEIGLRSLTPLTGVHFGTGVITAVRHAAGTTPRPTAILTSRDTIFANSFEQSRLTQYGMLLLPGDFILIFSNITSICSLV